MTFEWWSTIPFITMLAAIAVLPLVPSLAHHWERRGVQLAVALTLGLPVAAWFAALGLSTTLVHTAWEYVQFMTLLLALFVVSGGIFLKGDIKATPGVNTAFLAIGAFAASFIGTTGAAMLLIRPVLNTNRQRLHKVHTVMFLILIVANCGGLLTPLGDPPLFLGFLAGVPFEWTFRLFFEWLFVNGMLLVTYLALDHRQYHREPLSVLARDSEQVEPLGVKGASNFLWLAVVVLAVAFLPSMDLAAVEAGTATAGQLVPWRELVMLAAAAASYFLGDRATRFRDNEFTWAPIQEVATLFIGIFLTMMPALKFLAQIAPKLPLNDVTFFLFTGSLSSVLDNAPTYLTFFEMAKTLPGDPRVAGVPENYLVAISLGAVFCGALTYIGNGPNFMIKSVAEQAGVAMPSFGGYVLWSALYLFPTLIAMVLIFIAKATWTLPAGIALAVLLVARAVITVLRPVRRDPSIPDGAAS